MPEKKPEAQDIVNKRKWLQDIWAPTHRKMERIDSYIHRTFTVWPEFYSSKNYPNYHPSRANGILDHAVDNQLASQPTFHREPVGRGDTHAEKANQIEKWLTAAFVETALQEPQLTDKLIGRHLLAYGYTIRDGPAWDSQEKPDKPTRKRGETKPEWDARMSLYENEKRTWFPIRMRATHPARVLMDPMEKVPRMAIKHQHWFAHQLQELTEKAGKHLVEKWDAGGQPYKPVLCDSYWTRDWHILMVVEGSRILIAEPNTPGFVPFGQAFSGFGQEPTNMNEIDPQYMAVGILEPVLDELRAHSQAVSSLQNTIVENAFREWIVTGDAQSITAQRARGEATIETTEGTELKRIDVLDIPRGTFDIVAALERSLEFGTISEGLAGLKPPGSDTLGALAIRTQLGQRRFLAPSLQMEHLTTRAGSQVLRLVDTFGESITVRNQTIGPEHILSDYSISAKYELVDPVLSLQKREMGMREVKEKLKSPQTYMESDMGLEDGTGERERILESEIDALPEVKALAYEELLRRRGLRRLAEVQEDIGNQQLPGGQSLIDAGGTTGLQAGGPQPGGGANDQIRNALPRMAGFRPSSRGQPQAGSVVSSGR